MTSAGGAYDAKLLRRYFQWAVTIGTWSADTTPDERAQDMKSAIEFGITAPEIFGGLHEFDLAELPAAISAVTAPGKSGNVILKF